jgi:hypothetical protein
MKNLYRPLLIASVALTLHIVASGCGGKGLVNAKGRLTYKGKPVPSTTIIFHPDEEGKRASHGLTDDDGNFLLTNSMEDRGVFLGHHKVTLKYHLSAAEEAREISPKASKEMREVIDRYKDLSKTTLQVDITTSGQFLEIKLD